MIKQTTFTILAQPKDVVDKSEAILYTVTPKGEGRYLLTNDKDENYVHGEILDESKVDLSIEYRNAVLGHLYQIGYRFVT